MIDELMKMAGELAPVLREATERLNERIGEAERALAGLGLGVRATVHLTESHALVFGKEHKSWRLLIEREVGDNEVEIEPLANSSRELRIQALACLNVLVAEMVAVATAEIGRVNDAADMARAFVDEVQPPPPTPESTLF